MDLITHIQMCVTSLEIEFNHMCYVAYVWCISLVRGKNPVAWSKVMLRNLPVPIKNIFMLSDWQDFTTSM